MNFFQADVFTALLSIVLIDLVLAGDNAIVIGLAARNLPKQDRKKTIFWGTLGAILIRAIATMAVVWLLKIPGLLLIGGVLLARIAYTLLVDEKQYNVKAGQSVWAAIRMIIVADALMGIDNILAVAGAAKSDPLLVIIGLSISVPFVVWGSTMILKLVDRFPIIIIFGAGVLAWTSAKMIVDEPLLSNYFSNSIWKYGFEVIFVLAIVAFGMWKKNANKGVTQVGKQHSL
ncbi:TerC family protein [Ectobacillus polymachus]|uniref:TerC family protein n=1 Tax=Ectobacillus polymachus TaxID=1508806 RepID=UPI003A8B4252